jgi:hypothetical protein
MVHQGPYCIHKGISGTFGYQEGPLRTFHLVTKVKVNRRCGEGYTRFCGLTAGNGTAMIPDLPALSLNRLGPKEVGCSSLKAKSRFFEKDFSDVLQRLGALGGIRTPDLPLNRRLLYTRTV